MDENTVIGILTGSLITLFIKEIFNQINKWSDYKRDITKLKFTRKLEVAEKAVSFYSTYLKNIVEMKKSYEIILNGINEGKDLDINIIQNILNVNSKNLDILLKESHLEANTANLYFELDDSKEWNEQDISDFIENIAETKFKDNEIELLSKTYNDYLNENNQQMADFYWAEIEKLLPSYAISLQKVVNSFDKNRSAVVYMIKSVKEQI
ncbi:hypothetical protein [Acidiluteibacter ferrifornacis]|uniref:Uncharacterized protein n=1 Tax=Acidiluteibacter ferrifornacis TaxID=2692424 RepID=A0A6N9NM08_9FLAO|nr:hypothetical protein [Acidiluteibacter ferrifornacis]NBG66899.1 hypothetical protein [Acidiluteibacter ferrifornacis]